MVAVFLLVGTVLPVRPQILRPEALFMSLPATATLWVLYWTPFTAWSLTATYLIVRAQRDMKAMDWPRPKRYRETALLWSAALVNCVLLAKGAHFFTTHGL